MNNMKRAPQTSYYDFSAAPRVTGPRQKYRQDQQEPLNMMSDPRIVRGNTYAPVPTKSKTQFKNPQQTQKRPPPLKQSKPTNRFGFDMGFEVSTPRAIDGRQHFSAQTEAFVQTLRDKPIQYEYECQTDFYLDRPTQRLFKFVQNGVDASTQIYEGDPQLFDFNFQVEPILEALLSKVIDTSRMQLFEQEELHEALKRKREYELKRNAHLAEVQKLQNNETRMQQQKARREYQYDKYLQQSSFSEKKLIGRVLSKQLLKHLKNNSYAMLDQQGFFKQPLESDLYDNFLPWLYDQISEQLSYQQRVQVETEDVLKKYGQSSKQMSQDAIDRQAKRRQDVIDQKERIIREKQQRKRIKAEEKARLLAQQQLANQQIENPPEVNAEPEVPPA